MATVAGSARITPDGKTSIVSAENFTGRAPGASLFVRPPKDPEEDLSRAMLRWKVTCHVQLKPGGRSSGTRTSLLEDKDGNEILWFRLGEIEIAANKPGAVALIAIALFPQSAARVKLYQFVFTAPTLTADERKSFDLKHADRYLDAFAVAMEEPVLSGACGLFSIPFGAREDRL